MAIAQPARHIPGRAVPCPPRIRGHPTGAAECASSTLDAPIPQARQRTQRAAPASNT